MAQHLTLRPPGVGSPAAVVTGAIAAAAATATIAASVPAWGGVVTLLWLALVAVSSRLPAAGLALVAMAVPFEQQVFLPTVAGDLTPIEYTVWACAAGTVPALIRGRRLLIDRVSVMHVAIIVALVTSIAAGGVRVSTWWDVTHGWVLALLVYVLARSLRLDRRERILVVTALAAGVVTNLVMAMWQRATEAGPESFMVGGALRVFGTFLHPNTLAAYLALTLPMLLALSSAGRGTMPWVMRAAAAAGVVTLLMTQSRGGLLALGAAVAALMVLAPRPTQRWAIGGALAASLLLVATGAADRLPGLDRFSSISVGGEARQVTPQTWGQLEREAHWGAARSMMSSSPLVGVGAGEFNDHYREHTPEWRFRVGRGNAHNGYLQLGAEAGLPGLLAFAGWVGTIVVALWRRAIGATGIDYLLAAGALGTAVAWAVSNVFEHQDVQSIPAMFALIVAIGLGGEGALPPDGDAMGDTS